MEYQGQIIVGEFLLCIFWLPHDQYLQLNNLMSSIWHLENDNWIYELYGAAILDFY